VLLASARLHDRDRALRVGARRGQIIRRSVDLREVGQAHCDVVVIGVEHPALDRERPFDERSGPRRVSRFGERSAQIVEHARQARVIGPVASRAHVVAFPVQDDPEEVQRESEPLVIQGTGVLPDGEGSLEHPSTAANAAK
jgi:hypothetical protein